MKRYFASMKQYSWILLVCLVLSLAGGFYVAKGQPPVYSVSSVFAVVGYQQGGSNSTSPNDLLTVATNYAAQVPSSSVMSFVVQKYPQVAQRGYTADDLIADVVASPSTTTATVTLTATATKPGDAVLLANSVADGFSAYIQAQAQATLDAQRQDLQQQYAAFKTDSDNLAKQILGYPANDPHIALLTAQRSNDLVAMSDLQKQLSALPTTAANDVPVVQHASLPLVTSSGKASLVIVAVVGIGLLLGFLVMLLVIFLDKRLRSEEQVKEKLGLAYVGGISTTNDLKAGAIHLAGKSVQEFGDLAANLRLTGVLAGQAQAPDGSALLVTSPQVAEGKTTIAVGLATVAARGGQTVVVIDGNLSEPATHLAFGMSPVGAGLNGLLKGNGTIEDAVVRSNIPGVWLLPVTSPLEASALVLEQRMPAILTQLRRKTDLVIVDAPALLSSADASVLASMCDGVALVMDSRHEKLPVLLRAKDVLSSLTQVSVGIVANHRPRSRKGRNPYYATSMPPRAESETWAPVAAHESKGNGNGNGYHNGQHAEPVAVPMSPPAPVKVSSPPPPVMQPSPPVPARPQYQPKDLPTMPANPPSPSPWPGSGPR